MSKLLQINFLFITAIFISEAYAQKLSNYQCRELFLKNAQTDKERQIKKEFEGIRALFKEKFPQLLTDKTQIPLPKNEDEISEIWAYRYYLEQQFPIPIILNHPIPRLDGIGYAYYLPDNFEENGYWAFFPKGRKIDPGGIKNLEFLFFFSLHPFSEPFFKAVRETQLLLTKDFAVALHHFKNFGIDENEIKKLYSLKNLLSLTSYEEVTNQIREYFPLLEIDTLPHEIGRVFHGKKFKLSDRIGLSINTTEVHSEILKIEMTIAISGDSPQIIKVTGYRHKASNESFLAGLEYSISEPNWEPILAITSYQQTLYGLPQYFSPRPVNAPLYSEDFSFDTRFNLKNRERVRILIQDTGLDLNNPRFENSRKILEQTEFFQKSPYRFYDFDYHGTHVAHTAAMGSHSIDAVPLATFTLDEALKFNQEVIHAPIHNISQSIPPYYYDYFKEQPETLFIVAAGNYDVNLDERMDDSTQLISELENVIVVGATTPQHELALYSNYGFQSVNILAPGTLEAFVPGNILKTKTGTSMSTPFVSNVAAKMMLINPSLRNRPALVKKIILQSVHSDRRAYPTSTLGEIDPEQCYLRAKMLKDKIPEE